jgi:hypothetical protein
VRYLAHTRAALDRYLAEHAPALRAAAAAHAPPGVQLSRAVWEELANFSAP